MIRIPRLLCAMVVPLHFGLLAFAQTQSTPCSSITLTDIYGQPGTFQVFITQGSTSIFSSSPYIGPVGSYTIDASTLNLSTGANYSFNFYPYGYTGSHCQCALYVGCWQAKKRKEPAHWQWRTLC